MVSNSQYISAAQAADEFGFTRDYIARLARSGDIKADRRGAAWYVDHHSMRELVIKKEFEKEKRKMTLRETRKQEYGPGNLKKESKPRTIAPIKHIVRYHPKPGFRDYFRQLANMPHIPAGAVHAVYQSAQNTPYGLSASMDFLHRLFAIVFAVLLTFGTFGLLFPEFMKQTIAEVGTLPNQTAAAASTLNLSNMTIFFPFSGEVDVVR